MKIVFGYGIGYEISRRRVRGLPGGFIWYGRGRAAPFGSLAINHRLSDLYRRSYTLADAVAIVEWLRERDAGYPPHPKLMPDTAVAP